MSSKVDNVVVAGKSGAGKQPRIDVLVAEHGLSQLSTGNIFRKYLGAFKQLSFSGKPEDFCTGRDGGFGPDGEIRAALAEPAAAAGVEVDDAVLGLKAARFVDQGLFVPDEITNELFAAAFRAAGGRGLVLDGYPRTVDQSRFLLGLVAELGTRLDAVLMVENDDEAIVARTIGRRICPNSKCGKVFHLEFKPPRDGKLCTACGTEVILRSDDSEPKIRKRLQEFREKAAPAIGALVEAGVPQVAVPGNLPVFSDEAVRASVLDALRPVLG
jgi:adenylate kinase